MSDTDRPDVPAPTPMGAVRGCWPDHAPENRRRRAAYAACSHLLAIGADIWPAPMDTRRDHGPALPTGSQLADHHGIGFGAYVGPFVGPARLV